MRLFILSWCVYILSECYLCSCIQMAFTYSCQSCPCIKLPRFSFCILAIVEWNPIVTLLQCWLCYWTLIAFNNTSIDWNDYLVLHIHNVGCWWIFCICPLGTHPLLKKVINLCGSIQIQNFHNNVSSWLGTTEFEVTWKVAAQG